MLIRVYSWLLIFAAISAPADSIDSFVHDLLETNHLPGLSLAIIQSDQIVKAAGYGLANKEAQTPSRPTRLFKPARSVSRSQRLALYASSVSRNCHSTKM
jgi:CubicO group peptidase (beta-lactamase class C family)